MVDVNCERKDRQRDGLTDGKQDAYVAHTAEAGATKNLHIIHWHTYYIICMLITYLSSSLHWEHFQKILN